MNEYKGEMQFNPTLNHRVGIIIRMMSQIWRCMALVCPKRAENQGEFGLRPAMLHGQVMDMNVWTGTCSAK